MVNRHSPSSPYSWHSTLNQQPSVSGPGANAQNYITIQNAVPATSSRISPPPKIGFGQLNASPNNYPPPTSAYLHPQPSRHEYRPSHGQPVQYQSSWDPPSNPPAQGVANYQPPEIPFSAHPSTLTQGDVPSQKFNPPQQPTALTQHTNSPFTLYNIPMSQLTITPTSGQSGGLEGERPNPLYDEIYQNIPGEATDTSPPPLANPRSNIHSESPGPPVNRLRFRN